MEELELVFVTGMSGAGKSTALKMLEDMGYFCVDNLPVFLIGKMIELTIDGEEGRIHKVAMGVDIRSGSLTDVRDVLQGLREKGIRYKILFLDADDSTLIKRYKETRRSHPLAKGGRVESGIAREREQLAELKKSSDYILDTSQLLTRELRSELEKFLSRMRISGALWSRSSPLGLSTGFRQTRIWFSMSDSCRIRTMSRS